jgi:hypothetical protein
MLKISGEDKMSNRVSFFKFNCSQKSFDTLRQLVQRSTFSEKEEFGVMKFKNFDTYFSAVLLVKIPVFVTLADVKNMTKVKKEETFTFDFIPFGVDYNYQLLEVYTSRTKKRIIDDFFSEIGASGFGITDLETTLDDLISTVKKRQPEYFVNSIGFKDFQLVQGISGRFNAKITNNNVGKKMISQYAESISSVDLNLKMDNDQLRIKLTPPLNVQYWTDEGSENEAQLFIKRLFFKKIHTAISTL